MKTIEGLLPFSMAGISALERKNAAFRWRFIILSQVSSGVSWVTAVWVTSMPAECTKMSSPPRPFTTSSAALAICLRSVRSAFTPPHARRPIGGQRLRELFRLGRVRRGADRDPGTFLREGLHDGGADAA